MLTSITPLGERSRGQRWSITVASLLLGSTLGGIALGLALGALGEPLFGGVSSSSRLWFAAALLATGALAEVSRDLIPLPTTRRQVNEDWLPTYRGWLYGAGFGAQLGAGVLTIVTTWAVYVTFALCAASGSPAAGAVIGGVFGSARATAVLPAGLIRSPRDLIRLAERLERYRLLSWACGWAVLAALAVAALLAAGDIDVISGQG